MHKGGVVLQRLHEVWLHRVFQQHSHRTVCLDVAAGVALPLNPAHCALSDVFGTVQLAGVMRHAERAVAARTVK
jgi:hypothetical protein